MILTSKSRVIRHPNEIVNLVFGDPIITNPFGSFSETPVDAVLPDSGGQINVPLSSAQVENRRYDQLIADGKLIGDDLTRLIGRVEHPERPDYW